MTAAAAAGAGPVAHLAQAAVDPAAQGAVAYPTLFLLLLAGCLVPPVPSGALVSGAAAVAMVRPGPWWALLLIFLVSSLATFLGDSALYWLGRRGAKSRNGSRWMRRIQRRTDPRRLERTSRKLHEHDVLMLVVSRLLPGGRLPVVAACLLAEMPLRRFAHGALFASLAWTATYQAIGVLGGVLFPEPWQAVAAAIGLTLLIGAVPQVWRRLRRQAG
ncbi:VTT domain-containing protein [Streptomyces thermolineatus]|uniref:VTT domain-containing protein n=1 Tax=Streptomyces thermolineatus TaxID=44033 RepID=A0ABN3LXX9_9ACTN